MKTRNMMALGVDMTMSGVHAAAWRHPQARPQDVLDFEFYARTARKAEEGKLDFVFLADALTAFDGTIEQQEKAKPALMHAEARRVLEPITLFSALSVVTSRIGLVATATTTYNEPFSIARLYASLDHLSGGRAAWNVVTSSSPAEAYNFGRDAHPSPDERYARAQEFVDVVRALWDSVEDGAYVFRKDEGLYAKQDKIHFINHKGRFFGVRGPLNVPRTPQGRPVIFEAGSSPAGMELAARTADVVFTAQRTFEDARAFSETLRSMVVRHGRAPDDIRILPGVMPFVGRSEAEAREKQETLNALIDPGFGLHMLSDLLGGADLSHLDPDQPLPEDLPWHNGQIHRSQLIRDMARREGLTVRQVYERTSASRGHRTITGTPGQIADEMEDWFRRGVADGFNILLPFIPGGLDDFVDLVVPELQKRGIFRTGYQEATLRGHLGLPQPVNSFSALSEAV